MKGLAGKIKYCIAGLVASAFLYASPVKAQEATSYPNSKRKIVTFPGDLGQEIDAEENKKYNLRFDENLESLVMWQTNIGYHYIYHLLNVPEPIHGDLTKEEFEEIYEKIKRKYKANKKKGIITYIEDEIKLPKEKIKTKTNHYWLFELKPLNNLFFELDGGYYAGANTESIDKYTMDDLYFKLNFGYSCPRWPGIEIFFQNNKRNYNDYSNLGSMTNLKAKLLATYTFPQKWFEKHGGKLTIGYGFFQNSGIYNDAKELSQYYDKVETYFYGATGGQMTYRWLPDNFVRLFVGGGEFDRVENDDYDNREKNFELAFEIEAKVDFEKDMFMRCLMELHPSDSAHTSLFCWGYKLDNRWIDLLEIGMNLQSNPFKFSDRDGIEFCAYKNINESLRFSLAACIGPPEFGIESRLELRF